MHALIVDGTVANYPYSIGNLRRDNPNTSFPKRPTEELLKSWGMEVVAKVDRPNVDPTKNVTEKPPVLINGAWTQVWVISEASDAELSQRNDEAAARVREQRSRLLAESDWVVVFHTEKGTNIPLEWEMYRQQLRDITTQDGFPHSVVWPSPPA
jgi:hypothetical protein